MRLTERLGAADAGCVAVTSIAGHFCIEAFKAVSCLPVVDMIFEVGQAIQARGVKRIGILGTRTVMDTRFYGALPSVTIVPPPPGELDAVHDAYVAMAASGAVTAAQREIFIGAGRRMVETNGAEAVLLGGTDLALVFKEDDAPFPLIDCAAIHADAIMRTALA